MQNNNVYINVDTLAEQLNLSSSTVKKYYLLIEENGYSFKRSNQGHVMFSEDDYKLFKKIIEIKGQPKMTLAKAIDKVIGVITDTTAITPYNNEDMTVMTQKIKELHDLTVEQSQLITQQNQQIRELVQENRKSRYLLEDTKKNDKSEELLSENLQETKELKDLLEKYEQNRVERENELSQVKWWQFWK